MAKVVKLTKVEIFYIQSNPDKLSAEELSKSLKKPASLIQKHMVEDKAEEVVHESQKKERPKTHYQEVMGTKKDRRNGKKIAVVMTPTASEVGDTAARMNRKNVKDPSHIFKPYSE